MTQPTGARSRAPSIPYQPALDGLRGVAVAAVLLYHGGVTWMDGGFLGVDIFFTLSGFLITTLLLVEWGRTRTIRLGAFWLRRARRLLPALGLVLLGIALYAAFVASQGQLAGIRTDSFSTIGYVANWRFVLSGQGYFEEFATPSPFRHMWSLAIEEQFYLVWPFIVLGLLHWRPKLRFLTRLFVGSAVASALLMAVLFRSDRDPSRVYYGTDTRAQALLVGAALAAALLGARQRSRSRPIRSVPIVRAGLARRGRAHGAARGGARHVVVDVPRWVLPRRRRHRRRDRRGRPAPPERRARGCSARRRCVLSARCRTGSTCGTGRCTSRSPRSAPAWTAPRCCSCACS